MIPIDLALFDGNLHSTSNSLSFEVFNIEFLISLFLFFSFITNKLLVIFLFTFCIGTCFAKNRILKVFCDENVFIKFFFNYLVMNVRGGARGNTHLVGTLTMNGTW